MDICQATPGPKLHEEIKARVWNLRPKLVGLLRNYFRGADIDSIEESLVTGAIQVIENVEKVCADFLSGAGKSTLDDCIVAEMRRGAVNFLNGVYSQQRKGPSLDAELGVSDGSEMTFGMLLVSKRHDQADMERHVDAMAVARRADILNRHERKILMDLMDNVTAETAADEMKMTANEIRRERHRVLQMLRPAKATNAQH